MNQESEPEVKPRRNLLTALSVWAVGLWGSSRLLAATAGGDNSQTADPEPKRKHELTLLFGRLCLDPGFRYDFFDSKTGDEARGKAESRGLHITRADAKDVVARILIAHNSPNPVRDACTQVQTAIESAIKASIDSKSGCPSWPC